jgi:hypothetical protein
MLAFSFRVGLLCFRGYCLLLLRIRHLIIYGIAK